MSADLQGMSIMDTKTSKWHPLTHQQSTNHPFWSADSAWIYFNDIGDTGLWRVRVADGNVEELAPIPLPPGYNDCWAEALTSDGAAILECDNSQVDIVALDYKEQK